MWYLHVDVDTMVVTQVRILLQHNIRPITFYYYAFPSNQKTFIIDLSIYQTHFLPTVKMTPGIGVKRLT